jgi:hypothetical protein
MFFGWHLGLSQLCIHFEITFDRYPDLWIWPDSRALFMLALGRFRSQGASGS